jgi:hypothetical protein
VGVPEPGLECVSKVFAFGDEGWKGQWCTLCLWTQHLGAPALRARAYAAEFGLSR